MKPKHIRKMLMILKVAMVHMDLLFVVEVLMEAEELVVLVGELEPLFFFSKKVQSEEVVAFEQLLALLY